MSDAFLGQLLFAGFNFAPRGYAECNGQILPISQNAALFSLLGTQYGGNGVQTFGLPDLRARTPLGSGASADNGYQPPVTQNGQIVGSETVTLTQQAMPAHNHLLSGSSVTGTKANPADSVFATAGASIYGAAANLVALGATPMSIAGGSQPHPNMQPYAVIEVAIALQGIFPPRN